jgi:hypothetical protein
MNSKNELDARKAFAQACQGCVRIFQEMKKAYGGEAVAVEEGLKAAIAAAPKAKPAASSKAAVAKAAAERMIVPSNVSGCNVTVPVEIRRRGLK